MLGLPSTTEVGIRLPKESFYRNLGLDARTKDDFVHGVESVVVTNSIKPQTANFADGRDVHEIIVIEVDPREEGIPPSVLQAIFAANPARKLVRDARSGRLHAREGSHKVVADGVERLALRGDDLDSAWESILAQLAFGDMDGMGVLRRLEAEEAADMLRKRIAELDAKARRERQFARKNELIREVRRLRSELRNLEGER